VLFHQIIDVRKTSVLSLERKLHGEPGHGACNRGGVVEAQALAPAHSRGLDIEAGRALFQMVLFQPRLSARDPRIVRRDSSGVQREQAIASRGAVTTIL